MEDTEADYAILRRIKELQGWTLKALIAKRDELGLKMDPTRTYNLTEEIAREEVRRIEHPDDAVPGEVLQDTANTTYIKGELGDGYPAADVAGYPFQDEEDFPPFDSSWDNKIILNVDPREMKTESADFIVNTILPAFLEHFLRKNAGYGDRHRRTRTGIRGEFCGIDRKVDMVFESVWNGKKLEFEQPQELLWDLMGSCLLMLDLMAQED